MDSSLWKINTQPVSEFAKDLQLALVNQAPDRLTFNAAGELFDSAALFNYGDALSLYKGTDRWFAGVVLSGPRFGSPSVESHDYEVAGLWWYLEQLVFEQEWRAGAATLHKGHVILGRDIDNTAVAVGVVIKEVLDHVIAAGAPFAYVQTDLDLLTAVPPSDEQTDLACSEAISKMLRWIPDAVAWFDYSAATPELRFTRRAAATPVQYDCTAGKPTEQIEITRRDDLVQSGVIINYERVDTIDGERIPTLHPDIHPVSTTPGFDTANFTINIPGMQLSTQSVDVVVEELPLTLDTAYWTAFFLAHVAGAAEIEGFEILPDSVALPGDLVDYPNVLASGSVPAWSNKSVVSGEFTALAKGEIDGVPFADKKISSTLSLTDAESKLYTREISYTEADPIPVGLAQALYEAISQIHFDGRYNILESECTGDVRPGMVLNLSGGLVEWSTMRAAIQQVAFNLDTGRTTITFGPPEHLSPQDHIALLNANRRRITQYSADTRKTGDASGGEDIKTGGRSPSQDSTLFVDVGLPKMGTEEKEHMVVMLKEEEGTPGALTPVWGYRRLT